jgi:hypothetical protein
MKALQLLPITVYFPAGAPLHGLAYERRRRDAISREVFFAALSPV